MKFCVDIDDTLLYSKRIDNEYIIIGENTQLINFLNEKFELGNEVIIYTGRHWDDLAITKDQLTDAGIKYTTLVLGKPTADLYIDDKAIRPGEINA